MPCFFGGKSGAALDLRRTGNRKVFRIRKKDSGSCSHAHVMYFSIRVPLRSSHKTVTL